MPMKATDILGIGFPVACGSTYPHVWRFVDGLPEVTGTRAFMFDALASFSGGIVGPVASGVEAQGLPLHRGARV